MSSKMRLSSKNSWLQLHFYNRNKESVMELIHWELPQYLWKKGWLQVLVQRNTVPLNMPYCCKWPPEIMMVSFKYLAASDPLKQQHALNRNNCQIHCIIYAIHDRKCSSKKYSVHWKMGGRNYFREIKKYCTLKKIFLTYKEYFFRNHCNYFTAFSCQLLLH